MAVFEKADRDTIAHGFTLNPDSLDYFKSDSNLEFGLEAAFTGLLWTPSSQKNMAIQLQT